MKRKRLLLLLAIILTLALGVIQWNCPKEGMAISPGQRQFILLKNRADLPKERDFDENVTLGSMV